jgi:hypothetical protein
MSNDSPTGRAAIAPIAWAIMRGGKVQHYADSFEKARGYQLAYPRAGVGTIVELYAGTPPMVEAPEDPYQERRNIERSQAQGARSDEPELGNFLEVKRRIEREGADTEDALTDEQIMEIADSDECNPDKSGWGAKFDYLLFARAIIRALAKKP